MAFRHTFDMPSTKQRRCCFLLMLFCPCRVSQTDAAKCYALAFSGGGDKGSFEAGVVKGLVDRLPAPERQWDIMTGISAGSILASAGALFHQGDEVAMADFMINSTTSFTRDGVFKQWAPLGVLTGLSKTGLVDTRPFYFSLLKKLFGRRRGHRKFSIGATDDTTGSLVRFSEDNLKGLDEISAVARWASYVRASAAIPGLFQSVEVDGLVLSDGGARIGVDVFSAINKCRELADSDADIVVDIITCDERAPRPWNQTIDDRALELLLRGWSLRSYNAQMQDILDACLAYPDVNFRYYVEPPVAGLPSNGLNFNKTEMEEMVRIGQKQAAIAQPGAACLAAQRHRHSKKFPVHPAGPSSIVPSQPFSQGQGAVIV